MKTHTLLGSIILVGGLLSCQGRPQLEWVASTETACWQTEEPLPVAEASVEPLVSIKTTDVQQQIEGFGACFNELGWMSLNKLEPADRESVLEELFYPDFGANFTIARMPVGANDFSRDWYSYDEQAGDFAMESFTIANDKQTLIPFIHSALKYNADLKLWASPWSPPSWMKHNQHYASRSTQKMARELAKTLQAGESTYMTKVVDNGLPEDREGAEGTDMFICEPEYFSAYALYFSKFIDAYRKEGINISMVMPQNEFNSAQIFPSCCWTAAGLAEFVGNYLGPAMEEKGVEVMFGTMERPNAALVDTLLNDPESSKYIRGVGFQWAGKEAIASIHQRYPGLKLYQTEQECGDGKNTWDAALYAWQLMQHYLNNGTSAYMYWNISLEDGGISRWGWAQNSLVVVDSATKSYRYTPEYYIMKHVSHYVQPGAFKLAVDGDAKGLLAFVNPDQSIVVVVSNESAEPKVYPFFVDGQVYAPQLAPRSINTFLWQK